MNNSKYQLTNSQRSIYLLENYYSNTNLNNICGTCIIQEKINFDILKKSISIIIKNNNCFKLNFTIENNNVVQYINPKKTTNQNFTIIDINTEEQIQSVENQALKKHFDIFSENDLFEFIIFRLPNNHGGFLLNIHHLLSDSWSLGLTCKNIIKIYRSLLENTNESEFNSSSYINYCITENEYINTEKFQKDKTYWENEFKTIPEIASIPSKNKITSNNTSCTADRLTYILDKTLINNINSFCKTNKVSLFNFFSGIYSLYINRVTGLNDFTIGTPLLNRLNFNEKNTLGMFINTLPLRISFENKNNFTELISDISTKSTSLLRHQKYSYEYILDTIRKKVPNLPNLYNILLSYQITKTNTEGINYSTRWAFNGNCADELQIHILDLNNLGSLQISYDFKTTKYTKEEIDQLHQRILYIIEQILNNQNISLDSIDIITPIEKNNILYNFNKTSFNYDKSKTIDKLFEEQVNKSPNNIAVVFENNSLTYKELNEKANQLAHYIQNKNIKPGSIIGVILNRSLDLIITLLAILKSGCTYLPIDPDYPKDRINYMLDDSNASAIIVNNKTCKLTFNNTNMIDIKKGLTTNNYISININDLNLSLFNTKNLNLKTPSDNLMYIIYTSGSTGKPKGVMITHSNVHNFILGIKNNINFSPNKTMVSLTTICFDIFGLELWCSLICGVKLVLANELEQNNASLFNKLCLKNNINMIQTTPSRFNLYLNNSTELEWLNNITDILVGGESVPLSLLQKMQNLSNAQIYNMYGPTETTIWSTIKNLTNDSTISIGQPIINTKCYILDKNLNILPPYCTGTLYIGGDGVSKGYLNKNDLTAEKFIQSPYDKNLIIYNTNDLAYYTETGNIIHQGRNDFQVKYKGYRIELGEIENVISSFKNISSCAVIFKNDNLYAFYTEKENASIAQSELKHYILNNLPAYMMPSNFFKINQMPFTPNGKIDRKKLEIPDTTEHTFINKILPKTDLEKEIYSMISKISNNNNFSLTDDFFSIGMDSINIISLAIEISNKYNIDITTKELINFESIIDLITYINNTKTNSFIDTTKNNIKTDSINLEEPIFYDLSTAQKRIYYSTKMSQNPLVYNICGAIIAKKLLDSKKIQKIFNYFIKEHSVFRTSFKIIDNIPKQYIQPTTNISIPVYNTQCDDIQKLVDNYPKQFDLENCPLLRVEVHYINNNQTIILIDSHHIILDGTSLNLLIKEFNELYYHTDTELLMNDLTNISLNREKNNTKILNYIDYTIQENNYINSSNIINNKNYWLEKLGNAQIPVINLPYDYPITQNKTYNGDKITAILTDNIITTINNCAKTYKVTPYVLFLSALYILLYKYTSQEKIIIGTPITGRDLKGIENTIGMFVNNIPIIQEINSEHSFLEFINNVKREVLENLAHQPYPYDILLKDLNLNSGTSLFDVMFTYQNENINYTNNNIDILYANTKTSKFNLSIEIIPDKNILNIEYNTDLFSKSTINYLLKNYINVLNNLYIHNNDKNIKLKNISILSEEEKNKIIYDFNNNKLEYPKNITLANLFEHQVYKTPNTIAITFENSNLTFKELNEKANKLAHFIRENHIHRNDIIGIMVPRSLELIICILASLKAGCCYIPIDPSYPDERINYMLNNSKTKMLLTTKTTFDKVIFENKINIFNIDNNLNIDNPKNINLPDDNSYIIYTSGSTGKPKGVVLKHSSLVNLAYHLNNNLEFFQNPQNEKMASVTTSSFDIFLFETILCLQAGIPIVIANEDEQRIPSKLNKLLTKNNITCIQMTPSRMQFFIDNIKDIPALSKLKNVTLAGEPLTKHLVNSLLDLGIKKIYNGYGPSETTVFSSFTDVTKHEIITIGKALSNTKFYILDKDFNPCPIGIEGELFISGDGVGNGYLNNTDLTKKSFIPNPFNPNTIMYKVGDLCKWLDNGEVLCLGRVDNQIKIRGLRIELGEIENRILEFPFITKCIVVKQIVNNREFISAYYIATKRIKIAELRSFLSKTLPNYMLPSYYTALDKFPQTPNGKIDKKALPLPELSKKQNNFYIAPTTDIETQLVRLFEEILSVSPIGVSDNFFELGGDSILAMRLNIELLKICDKVKYADIFNNPTILDLTNLIKQYEANSINTFLSVSKNNNNTVNTITTLNYESILNNTKIMPSDFTKSQCTNLLLTGATGFLGIHILDSYLKNNLGKIYCIVRNEPGLTPEKKLLDKLHYYFGTIYDDLLNEKIFIVEGDITKPNFGLKDAEFNDLASTIDIVINSAAKVAHFGKYEDFYKVNVLAVQNLIKFCNTNQARFYQISTLSVSGNSFADSYSTTQNFTEERMFDESTFNIGQTIENVYVKSKYEAEKLVLNSMLNNTNSYILRVGNLMPRYSDGLFQENISENAYLNRLSAFINLKILPESIINSYLEFTPIDYCADAIIKIIQYPNNTNKIFNLFNHNHIYLTQLLQMLKELNYNINVINTNEFKNTIKNIINDTNKQHLISNLSNDFGENFDLNYTSNIKIKSDFTIEFLDKLDFKWPIIDINYIKYILKIINESR